MYDMYSWLSNLMSKIYTTHDLTVGILFLIIFFGCALVIGLGAWHYSFGQGDGYDCYLPKKKKGKR